MSAPALVLAAALAAAPVTSPTPDATLETPRFGTVHLYRPAAGADGPVVLFLSGDGGWNLGVVDMARALTSLGALVVGIDVPHYLREAAASKAACTSVAIDLEALGQEVQRRTGAPRFRHPLLAGYSSGATLVYAALAQAPAGTFLGGISLGFCPDIEPRKPLCRGEALVTTPTPDGKGVLLAPVASLTAPWIAFQGEIDEVCGATTAAAYVARVGGARLVRLPHVGHGFSVRKNWMPQLRAAFGELTAPVASSRPAAPVADLPLIELPVAAGDPGEVLAFLASGDGGWAGLDRAVAAALQRRGVPVVGFDSLQYLWTRRTPDELGSDLTRTLRHYLAAWKRTRVLLVGYSLGADLVPFMASRLPEDLRSRVVSVVLIGPDPTVGFEFHVTEWLGASAKDEVPVAPEIAKLAGLRVVCVRGEAEDDSLCRKLEAPEVVPAVLPGGHHFAGDYAAVARRVLEELP